MNLEQLFPFEYVPKDSRVIIYGYGVFGRAYISQIKETKWCSVVGVMDKKYEKLDNETILDISICKNCGLYDYIVVAISDLIVGNSIIDMLVNNGAKRETIVFHHDRHKADRKQITTHTSNIDKLVVQFLITGGIGDGIMETAFYNRLIQIVPDAIIDVYGEPYLKFIYENKANVRNVCDYNNSLLNVEDYDLIIQASWGVKVHYCNYETLKAKAGELYDVVRETEKYENKFAHMSSREKQAYRVKEAQANDKDRFWLMGCGDIWKLSSNMMKLELFPGYLEKYRKLNLKKYITVNSGADLRKTQNKEDVITKTWPPHYFEEFISKFKHRYPGIEVIQIGGKYSPRLEGTDLQLLGEDLELVEYIVHDSILHIDDEGGLVHMATALGIKCVVLFGPTPMSIFAYKHNINICAETCKECFSAVPDWNLNCVNRIKYKKCMYDITPDMVMVRIADYMDNIKL